MRSVERTPALTLLVSLRCQFSRRSTCSLGFIYRFLMDCKLYLEADMERREGCWGWIFSGCLSGVSLLGRVALIASILFNPTDSVLVSSMQHRKRQVYNHFRAVEPLTTKGKCVCGFLTASVASHCRVTMSIWLQIRCTE
jgi:hypothetical protein